MLLRYEKQLIDAFRKNHPDSTEKTFHNWFNARKSEGNFDGESYDDVRNYFFYGSSDVSSEDLKNKIIRNAHDYDFELPADLDDFSHKQLVDFDRRQDKAMANYHKELVRLSKEKNADLPKELFQAPGTHLEQFANWASPHPQYNSFNVAFPSFLAEKNKLKENLSKAQNFYNEQTETKKKKI